MLRQTHQCRHACVVAKTRSDYDGFILFERVAYGRYSLRLATDSAKTAGVSAAIGNVIDISPGHSVARLGAIRISKTPRIARKSHVCCQQAEPGMP